MLSRRHIAVFLGSSALLARADLFDDYINSTSKKPFVSFLGRKGNADSIGHAFVGVGVQIDSGLRVYERLFGLYPKDGALAAIKSMLSKQAGQINYQWKDVGWDSEVIKWIDDSQKKAVLAQFATWSNAAPQYSLTENGGINCSGLVADVAKSAGLTVPSGAGSTRPWKYIESLKVVNP